MEQNQNTLKPRNIFEAINQNVVDMSQDVVKLYAMVAEMHTYLKEIRAALYPPMPQEEISEPNADGAETINE